MSIPPATPLPSKRRTTRKTDQTGKLPLRDTGKENAGRRKRELLKKAGEMVLGGLIGDIAIKILGRASEMSTEELDKAATSILDDMIGVITVPVWTGDKMFQVLCDFTHTSTGYVLKAKQVTGVYKDVDDCYKLGEDMIKMGVFFMKSRKLRMKVDFKEIEHRLG